MGKEKGMLLDMKYKRYCQRKSCGDSKPLKYMLSRFGTDCTCCENQKKCNAGSVTLRPFVAGDRKAGRLNFREPDMQKLTMKLFGLKIPFTEKFAGSKILLYS
jgi:hypothetical protein